MAESTHVKDHPYNFNCIIHDLEGVVAKIEDENESLSQLRSLSNYYESFIDTLVYGKTPIIVN